jgi:SAM-dependent MidA family methyltransferase
MVEHSSRVILPDPPDELKQLSHRLTARIREKIGKTGSLSFSDYMEMALYEPGLGYYSAGLHKIGPGGDFVTAPELGGLFAACLARQVAEAGKHIGPYDIVEVGAGTGRLAADLLNNLEQTAPPARYAILERSADLRAVQKKALLQRSPRSAEKVVWLDQPPEHSWNGILLANEVIDALPVERFENKGGHVTAMAVKDRSSGFEWDHTVAADTLMQAINTIPEPIRQQWPDGYRSEINPALAPWVQAITATLNRGVALFIDYGYPRQEYYLPERTDGTLICHYRHRAHDNPFHWPGLQDITASVEFTALAEAGEDAGLKLAGYTNQTMFLLGCGLEQIIQEMPELSQEQHLKMTTEARQLTMPGLMGERFQVMALGRDFNLPMCGFSLLDLSYRL